MKIMIRQIVCRFIFPLTLMMTISVVKAGNIENLAVELAKIRGSVEELQSQLDQQKEAHQNQMRVLTSQMTDLSVEQRRQNVSIEKMQQSLVKFEESNAKADDSGKNLKPVLLQVLSDYADAVKKGFPFKTEERLSVINELHSKIDKDLLEPKKAANQVWAALEDEIRISKGNGIYQQTIELQGERVLADVAKLGTILLYFQTRDGAMGMAKKLPQEGWKFVTVDSRSDKEKISLLFESLKKQIRQGYFELPNPLKS